MSVSEQERFQRRVLEVTRHLGTRLASPTDKPTLHEVDGAFYWIIVDAARVDRIFNITEKYEPEQAVRRMLSEHVPPAQLFAALRQGIEDPGHPDRVLSGFHERIDGFNSRFWTHHDESFLPLVADLQAEMPRLMHWVTFGEPPSLWAPWLVVNNTHFAAWDRPATYRAAVEETVTLYIPDASYEGKHIEELIERTWHHRQEPRDGSPFWQTPPSESLQHLFGIGARVSLGNDPEPRGLPKATDTFPIPTQPVRFRYIELSIKSPRTAKGFIRTYYDEMVVKPGWPTLLSGKGNDQQPINAIRGWAVGLLSNKYSNMTRDEAYRQVAIASRTERGDPRKFSDHLKPVLERVPWVETIIGLKNNWSPNRMR